MATPGNGSAGKKARAGTRTPGSITVVRPSRASSGLAKAPTMSNRQYIAARAKADIAKVQRAVNSPAGKKVQAAAVGFGKGVAKASKGAVAAGKAARSLADKFR